MSGTRVLQNGDRVAIGGRPQIGRQTAVLGQSEKRNTERTANILLVDHSGSTQDRIAQMDKHPKIAGIKDAVSMFIVNAPESSYLSVICFGDIAEVLSDMQVVGQNRLSIIQKVQAINPQGSTAMCAAFKLAEEQCMKAPVDFMIRIYALTDGLPTDGSPLPIIEDLKKKYQNLQIHTIGFGHGTQIDEDLLRKVASCSSTGNPFYYHIIEALKLTGVLKRQSRTLTM